MIITTHDSCTRGRVATMLAFLYLLVNSTTVAAEKGGEQINLSGLWRSPKKSVFVLVDNGMSVSVWLMSSETVELVDARLEWADGRLTTANCSVVFKADPWKACRPYRFDVISVPDEEHLRVKYEEIRFNTAGKIDGRSMHRAFWTRISAPDRDGHADEAPALETERDLSAEKSRLQEELSDLEKELRTAYSSYRGVLAEANAFANLKPAERTRPNLQDRYNGTIIDGRYADEPVIELSPASPRYGRIVGSREAWMTEYQRLVGEIAETRADLARVTPLTTP